ncbi:copper amine oxidase N-terminal domain-containing protein [Paenibacillus sp. EKM202P]|uniref:copper amine oxidase N-terminal domain-containing protein n=1 Tax=unclassified Paenibacillus TaxID=185978 RepID=UPI0013ED3B40|nr:MULTISPECIES: copper amine oxidase N-terminal domain-containing protein [unclassified Paenibacillus]KAF6563640.1 copper amine oxidase N-terminal domain-containing protein [Paenibacillus sp. EKM202P]KAF6568661.1 copper amine oxidase N-terminal domain-containing protein [Paenibacillus sp. EKM207P]
MLKRIILPLAVIFVFVSSISVENAYAGSKFSYNVEVDVNNSALTLDPFGEKSTNENNSILTTDINPYIERSTNTVYVPIKFISEGLGESVSWNRPTQEVTIKSKNGTIIRLTVGSKVAYVNDEEKMMPSAPVMPEFPNRVMVPLRFVSEVLGAIVNTTTINGTLHVHIKK